MSRVVRIWCSLPKSLPFPTPSSAATGIARAATAAATEIRLQQMCERVDVVQFAVLHAEEMTVGRAAAAVGISGAERAEHLNRADRLVDDEAAVGDVHTTRNADIAAVRWRPVAGVRAAFGAITRIAPRDQILFPFEKRIEIGVGSRDKRAARVALIGGNDVPLFRRRVLQVVVSVEQPI